MDPRWKTLNGAKSWETKAKQTEINCTDNAFRLQMIIRDPSGSACLRFSANRRACRSPVTALHPIHPLKPPSTTQPRVSISTCTTVSLPLISSLRNIISFERSRCFENTDFSSPSPFYFEDSLARICRIFTYVCIPFPHVSGKRNLEIFEIIEITVEGIE